VVNWTTVFRLLIAILLGVAILALGVWLFRAIAFGRPPGEDEDEEPEDVSELDVFFVCTECGTEFRVEKLGELQVPRHCGEKMVVERRPRAAPDLN
jgi:DNA-directed RNA polymerase subunit RPC12/RpoP